MEIYPQAAELQGERENNLCLSDDLELRVLVLSQDHDTPLHYKEHMCKVWWKSIRRQLNYKAKGKIICAYLMTLN